MDSPFIGVAIGLVLMLALLSALTSTLTEAVARFIGLRGEYLLRGLRTMVASKSDFSMMPFKKAISGADSDVLREFLAHPLVEANGNKGVVHPEAGNKRLKAKDRRRLPSYISGRTAAVALLEVVIPNAAGQTTLTNLEGELAKREVDERLKKVLLSLAREARNDIDEFRRGIERWYDEHMARVSGWYKRHTRWISLGIALVIVLVLNLNGVRIASALYLDEPLRAAVVAAAQDAEPCTDDAKECLAQAREQVAPLAAAGLPIGWTEVAECAELECTFWERYGFTDPVRGAGHDLMHLGLTLLGYALLVIATLPGARFWFDALGRLNSLRSTGPRPPQK
jgi:hypothetical protein